VETGCKNGGGGERSVPQGDGWGSKMVPGGRGWKVNKNDKGAEKFKRGRTPQKKGITSVSVLRSNARKRRKSFGENQEGLVQTVRWGLVERATRLWGGWGPKTIRTEGGSAGL